VGLAAALRAATAAKTEVAEARLVEITQLKAQLQTAKEATAQATSEAAALGDTLQKEKLADEEAQAEVTKMERDYETVKAQLKVHTDKELAKQQKLYDKERERARLRSQLKQKNTAVKDASAFVKRDMRELAAYLVRYFGQDRTVAAGLKRKASKRGKCRELWQARHEHATVSHDLPQAPYARIGNTQLRLLPRYTVAPAPAPANVRAA
jgi:hypothetical protein